MAWCLALDFIVNALSPSSPRATLESDSWISHSPSYAISSFLPSSNLRAVESSHGDASTDS
ncbi:hypothetical protein Cantr_07320 [Candida viswanathii]|uniref:Uncharacterized protein n=1 Tax=Candida viswanathii TaxID=5486 RepID=A0A367Y1C2_9ASCO|nr:hypothetical protein Cantr_07320 [Candida viswanathii]